MLGCLRLCLCDLVVCVFYFSLCLVVSAYVVVLLFVFVCLAGFVCGFCFVGCYTTGCGLRCFGFLVDGLVLWLFRSFVISI